MTSPKQILVVDNQEFNVDLVRTVLTRGGFEVIAAVSGVEAIEMVKVRKPDLVLMDLQLPEMDGLETTRRLLEDPKCKGVKVVAFSALAMTADRERALEAGCIGYITKPIGARDLIAEVKSYLK